MIIDKEWRWDRRYGGIRVEYHLWSWGVGVHVGGYHDDWELIKPKGEVDYLVVWLHLDAGPFEVEFSLNGPEKMMPEEKWMPLGDLREGAVFETKGGVVAMKTEYSTFCGGTQCDCYLLESGEAAHFPDKDGELVRELSEEECYNA